MSEDKKSREWFADPECLRMGKTENDMIGFIPLSVAKIIKNRLIKVQEVLSPDPRDEEILRLRAALETLRVAVNDKQPDPGAVNFIDKALSATASPSKEESRGEE